MIKLDKAFMALLLVGDEGRNWIAEEISNSHSNQTNEIHRIQRRPRLAYRAGAESVLVSAQRLLFVKVDKSFL